jgi:hypothetical protein
MKPELRWGVNGSFGKNRLPLPIGDNRIVL